MSDEEPKVVDTMKEISDDISSEIEKSIFDKEKFRGIIGDNIAKLENLNKTIEFQLPLAIENEKEKSEEIKKRIQTIYSQGKEQLESVKDDNDKIFKIFVDNLVEVKFFEKEIKLHQKSNSVAITLNSYYIYCYSIFDSFINELLRYVLKEKNDYLNSDEKSISYSKILTIGNQDKIISYIINKDIETIQRKSYIKQFLQFEKLFNLSLRKFKNWPKFIENSQRRNLIVHCNGIASEQYVLVCKENKVKLEDNILGQQLIVDEHYLKETIELLTEIIFKLGHTLWRKIFPEQMEESDIHIANYIYNILQNKDHSLALQCPEKG